MINFTFLEEVIRRRLLIDGDGTGDDRRINALIKSFIKWCNSENESQAERLFKFYIILLKVSIKLYNILQKLKRLFNLYSFNLKGYLARKLYQFNNLLNDFLINFLH